MTEVLLSLGSNVDNPPKQITKAIRHLGSLRGTEIVLTSKPVITPPWGKTDQPDFINLAVLLRTTLSVVELMEDILVIELKMGRLRQEKWGPRKIDIDIILFGDEIVRTPVVQVPHPHMHERRFVLEPAVEIAPGMMHPIFDKTIAELLAGCPDSSAVESL